jgi:organic radical activating enzyme
LVWLQPVNYENDLKKENLDRCLAILKEFPHWRLSMQAHKIWRVR